MKEELDHLKQEFERAKQAWAQKELDNQQDREVMFNTMDTYRTQLRRKEVECDHQSE